MIEILFPAFYLVFVTGLLPLLLSDSPCMTMFRWLLIVWSYDQIEKITQNRCCKSMIIFSMYYVVEFVLSWMLTIFYALTLGILVWFWIAFWYVVYLRYCEMKYNHAMCNDKNKTNIE